MEKKLIFRNYKPRSLCFKKSEDHLEIFENIRNKILNENIETDISDTISFEREYNFDIKRDFNYIAQDLELKKEKAIINLINEQDTM